jgi:hypothetical protein
VANHEAPAPRGGRLRRSRPLSCAGARAGCEGASRQGDGARTDEVVTVGPGDYPRKVMAGFPSGSAVRRHGAALVMEDDQGVSVPLALHPTLTRRGSRQAFSGLQRTLISHDLRARLELAAADAGGVALIAARFESGRAVERIRIPYEPPPGDLGLGVREPRRPLPKSGQAATTAAPGEPPR